MSYWSQIRDYIKDTANIAEYLDTEAASRNIRSNIFFRGPNVWILAFSMIIASVGLNVNSTAVIIGAMLISPLMGPIIGMGLGLGVNDTHLLTSAVRNLVVMVVISLLASSIYFVLSPLNLVNPTELEARTSPTIYDVLIALFGGFAGILEQARKEKGTVLSGVAIATALMPPLCTAGYGLAKMDGHFFFGAMGLFIINMVFITLATYLAVKYLRFHSVEFESERAERRTRRVISAVILLVTLPSIWSAARMIRDNNFSANVEQFVAENRVFGKAYIYDYKVTKGRDRSVTLFTTGEEMNTEEQLALVGAASKFGIPADRLIVKENGIASGDDSQQIIQGLYDRMDEQLEKKDSLIRELRLELSAADFPYVQLTREAVTQYPEIVSLNVSRGALVSADSLTVSPGVFVTAETSGKIGSEREKRLVEWLKVRLNDSTVVFRQQNR